MGALTLSCVWFCNGGGPQFCGSLHYTVFVVQRWQNLFTFVSWKHLTSFPSTTSFHLSLPFPPASLQEALIITSSNSQFPSSPMASEEMGLFSAQRLDNGLNPHHPQLVFPESFSCGPPPPPPPRRDSAAAVASPASAAVVGDPGPKTTRELTGFLDHHHYFRPQPPQAADFRGSVFADRRDWNTSSRASTTPSGDGSEDDEDDDDEDDNEDENEAEGRAVVDNNSKVNNNSDKVGNQKPKDIPNFGKLLLFVFNRGRWSWLKFIEKNPILEI